MPNKVLYIGNYKDNTGWGNAALNNILAMDSVGINVVPRAISFEARDSEYPEKIKKLESKSSFGCNVCIQHTLPHLFSYNAGYKNIGFMETESAPFRLTGWVESANLMDEIWVPSYACKGQCRMSGITKPIKIVPHCINVKEYTSQKAVCFIKEIEKTFNFLFVGEFIERKNIKALVKAFHAEFRAEEPVSLVIKTSRIQSKQVEDYCEHIRNGLKLRKNYSKERIITGKLESKIYVSVIKQCHSFVMPSRGEAFCIPALEAMACGIPVIWTAGTGMDDFAVGTKVDSREEPCFGAVDTLPYLDNYHACWQEIDARKLQFAMRSAFMRWQTDQSSEESKKAINASYKCDHATVGETIKEILNDG